MNRCDDLFEEIGELCPIDMDKDLRKTDISKELKLLGWSEKEINEYNHWLRLHNEMLAMIESCM